MAETLERGSFLGDGRLVKSEQHGQEELRRSHEAEMACLRWTDLTNKLV